VTTRAQGEDKPDFPNTILIRVLLCHFGRIGPHTSVWIILLLALYCIYTSMNTLI
jgi:hypothetical protein